jgi:DNA (cytosine-5)-methyltransferase 1
MANPEDRVRYKYSILSLFTGAGALDYAFELTGRFTTLACLEAEALFCETLRRNKRNGYLKEAAVIQADVAVEEKLTISSKFFGGKSPDVIVGGPPCESFSIRGKKLGLADPRGNLVFTFFEWVEVLKPRCFVMENVPPLSYASNGNVLRQLQATAQRAGYHVSSAILNSADYGAATKRRRLFLVGFHNSGGFRFPAPTHTEDELLGSMKPHCTVEQALTGLPSSFESEPATPQAHVHVKHTDAVVERFGRLRLGQEDRIRKRTRLHPLRPSPSLVAGNLAGIRSHIHPFEPRELTNRESARLHGFPDQFEFFGSHAAIGKQIANSVPIPLAQALAQAIASHFDRQSRTPRT